MRWAEVVGDPIAHSRSPAIHRFWLQATGVAGGFRATRLAAAGLADWLAARRADPDWVGASLTMPLKEAVLPHLDRLSERAARLGAVNCVVREGEHIVGHNSDVDGVAEPLQRHGGAAAAQGQATVVQIVGAGGAARAAAMGAAAAGHCDIRIFNRTPARAVEVARWWGLDDCCGQPLAALGPVAAGAGAALRHLVINASPMGMAGLPPLPIPIQSYPGDTLLFDMVYAPLETPLLAAGRARGMATIDGLEMLVAQAAVAFALWFGVAAPRARDAALRALLAGG